ncbi:unnamed protein product [Rotaria magnacalcarata]|uniref:SWIM-type domain-containing protein n=3 Tax=Rotaria magnacalcarata TaxID=392030 RepID=A0A816BB79_9BILA|nr:unnamed protein product [Rotaria magnacalcarata]
MQEDKDSFFTKQFDNWEHFEEQFIIWCNHYHEPVNIKRSSMKYNEKTMNGLFDRFRYEHVKYVCHHSGRARRNIKDGSRPNQESARIDCEFFFKIKHDTDINKIIFTKIKNLKHNHPIDERIYKNYSFIRNKELKGNQEVHDLCKTLITANASTYNNRKLLNKKFDINLTRKDINNFKQKIKFNLVGNRTDAELLQVWIDEILNENPNNSIQIKLNEDGNLECLYIQTMQMKAWLEKYPNILHLDSTIKVNIENYQLYICMAQNANLKGVPVSYCLMNSGNKDNLEFFYAAMRDLNDLQKTQVIMVDKDLTNIDILQHFFDKARILLCVFHVLKYLKSRVHELRIPLTNRMNIMKNIRRLLYDNDQMSAIYLKEVKTESEGTDFYQYFETNWLSCCEMWQTKHRKNLFNFDTDTNNHLERFNRTLKDHILPKMHISECVVKLILAVEDARTEEMNTYISLKQKICDSNDSTLVQRFGSQLINKAIDLLRKQNDELKQKHYSIEELEDNSWKIGQKDEEKNRFITSSIIHRDSFEDLLFCDCDYFLQNQLPCRHMIFLFDRLDDEKLDQANGIHEIVSINKRWLKATVDYYLNEIAHYDSILSSNTQYNITQMATKKNNILSSNEKYNIIKPTLDLLTARITQYGTDEFRYHVNFLNIVLDLINVNKHKELYIYAINLKKDDTKQPDCETERELITNSSDDIKQESPVEQAIINNEEKIEKHQEINIKLNALEQEHEMKLCKEQEKVLPNLQLKREEAGKNEDQSLSTQKLVLSYSPVINPRGRPRGKASFVSYKQKDNKTAQDKNKKRIYNHVSPDLKTYKHKRNKKVESVSDVYDNAMWLTDLHIHLFFELLQKQFPNINGLCGPAQIHLYTSSLENSIFIFNANNNHWLTIANLDSDNVWKVYDSLSYPKESLVKFFQDILPGEERVTLSFENVQQQVGGNDCGLFALCFATSLCYNEIPSSLFYDQKSLRHHYVNCIENSKIERFPSKSKRGSTRNNCKLVDLYLN